MERSFDVKLADLRYLSDQISDRNLIVYFDHHSHWLIVVYVVVALGELGKVLLVTVRLTRKCAGKATWIRILDREVTALVIWIRICFDLLETSEGHAAFIVNNRLVHENIFDSVCHSVNDDRYGLL